MEAIDAWDRWAIRAWHEGWHPAALDAVAPWWRERATWLPLYVALLAWLLWRARGWGLANAAAAGLAVGLSDFTAAGLLKPWVGRVRPCNLAGLREHLDLLTGCGAGLSFPSAHAANHFALAALLGATCFAGRPRWRLALWLWAGSIALAQVYVGRHYPSDVIAGALLGTAIGVLVARGYRWVEGRFRKTGHGDPTATQAATGV